MSEAMNGIYSEKIILRSKDVNMYRKLRTSRLFELIQEISIRHTELLGAGRAFTLDRGLLWVVTMQSAVIHRMPEFDEELTIETWPGDTMHVLFPRFYRIRDHQGKTLISASAIWTLIDHSTRKYVFPQKYGIEILGVHTGDEIELPSPPANKSPDHEINFEVPFSYVDLNGHMNNTRYFDLVEDRIIEEDNEKVLKSICTEYCAEICYKDQVNVSWQHENNQYFIMGSGTKKYFKMLLEY